MHIGVSFDRARTCHSPRHTRWPQGLNTFTICSVRLRARRLPPPLVAVGALAPPPVATVASSSGATRTERASSTAYARPSMTPRRPRARGRAHALEQPTTDPSVAAPTSVRHMSTSRARLPPP